jgi:hypothetical protein
VSRTASIVLLGAALGCIEPRPPAAPPPAVATTRPSASTTNTATQASARDALVALLPELEALQADTERVPASTPLAEAVARARKDVAWLERNVGKWPVGPPLDGFVAAFVAHRHVLAEAREAPAAEAALQIDAVARDLAVKAQQCRTFGGPVPVNVRVVTRDAENREVSGYEVWFVRKAYERMPAAYRRFEQNSSPAGHIFNEAGYYVIWADHLSARARRQRGVPLDLEVGPDRREQVVDLIVPDATANTASVTP